MKKKLTMVAALVLVFALGVTGTLAYLTAKSDTITNTFTVGNVTISLAETTGTSYKVVPGATVSKDPKVTVASGSEKCYVYVTVENNLVIGTDTVGTLDISATDWTVVQKTGNKTLYRYKEVVDASTAAKGLQVFTTVSYDGTKITEANIGTLASKTIAVQAFAHQSENVTQTAADTAAKGWAFPTT